MHGHRQEEDRVTVVGPRSSAEVFLHGFDNWKQLFRQLIHIMHYYLGETPETPLSHCLWGRAQHRLPLLSQHGRGARRGLLKHRYCWLVPQLHKVTQLLQTLCVPLSPEPAKHGRERREGFLQPFHNCEMGRDSNPHTQSSVFNVLWVFSGLFPLPNATMYLVCHMESIRRGECSLQALASCRFEASQTTSLTLRTKPCSLPQRQAVTGPGMQPGFPEPQPGRETSSAARPASARGGREDGPQHAAENPDTSSYSRAEHLL